MDVAPIEEEEQRYMANWEDHLSKMDENRISETMWRYKPIETLVMRYTSRRYDDNRLQSRNDSEWRATLSNNRQVIVSSRNNFLKLYGQPSDSFDQSLFEDEM